MKSNNLKQFLKNVTCTAIAFALIATPLVQQGNYAQASQTGSNVTVTIDGQVLSSDVGAFIKDNRTLIPLRAVMENLGANVEWDEINRAVTISKGTKIVKLYIDNRLISYTDNGVTTYDVSDVAPIIKENRTFVPVRLVSNALGQAVEWDANTRTAIISSDKTSEKTEFFNIDISNITDGQVLTNKTQFTLSEIESLPSNSAQIRYLFLDPTTGMGKIVAKSLNISEPVNFTPDINNQGSGILACVILDKNGNFLAGTAKAVSIAVNPTVTLKGVTEGSTLTKLLYLSSEMNFTASYTKYEVHYPGREMPTYIFPSQYDPNGKCAYLPEFKENGTVSFRVVAYDSNNTPYYSDFVTATVKATPPVPAAPYVSLANINANNVGIIPVKLSVSRNFDVDKTQYYAENTATGKTVLLHENHFGDYSWFPGPSMAGTWNVFAVCTKVGGERISSNVRTVTVPNKESLVLSGVGPDQVITGDMSVSSTSNVPLKEISYVLSNPNNGTQKVLGTANSTSEAIKYTPTSVNEGKRNIQAIGITEDGRTLQSEVVSINIYLKETFGPKPVVAKDKFIEFVTPLALQTQKVNGMSAALQIAQAILETGWGQKVPVDKYTGQFSNNLFGVKGTGDAGSVIISTYEEYYGTLYLIDDYFRAYTSVQGSWDDHNALLTTRERYIPYYNVMYNSSEGAFALKRCGYATDSGYPFKLIQIIKTWDLDKLDEQKI